MLSRFSLGFLEVSLGGWVGGWEKKEAVWMSSAVEWVGWVGESSFGWVGGWVGGWVAYH